MSLDIKFIRKGQEFPSNSGFLFKPGKVIHDILLIVISELYTIQCHDGHYVVDQTMTKRMGRH